MPTHRYFELDVFAETALAGNPLAVVLDAGSLETAQMQRFANWTNLSETTFLLEPTVPEADYRVRIFTPARELPFAGHPTLGSCQAWLAAGGKPRDPQRIVQQCAVGCIALQRAGERLAFAAPPSRQLPLPEERLAAALSALGLARSRLRAAALLDNGPQWLGLLVDRAATVLELAPDMAALAPLGLVGVIGPVTEADRPHPGDFEVRAFAPGDGIAEDPVTGSLNAALAQWLIGAQLAPAQYLARQGTRLGRDGRVHVAARDGTVWIGGRSPCRVEGTVHL